MSSYVDVSLEDIIKKKGKNTRAKRGKVKAQQFKPPKMAPITDARNKIISKNRTQITDAREKLAQFAKQKDARLKLDKLHQERGRVPGPVRNKYRNRGIFSRAPLTKDILFADSSRQAVSQPLITSKISLKRQINTHTSAEVRTSEKSRLFEFQHKPNPKPLCRPVEHDLEIIDDFMGDEYVPEKKASLNRVTNLQLKIITHNNDNREDSVATIHRTIVAEKKKKSPRRAASILNKLPMTTLRIDAIAQKTEKPRLEYRIIVSNSRPTVTGSDIKDLFEDVGIMLESRLVGPGIAEVIYKTQEDAQKAVFLFHNRHLDGQPINCLLATRRSPAATSSNKPELYSTHSNVEPDISIFHKVLFRNL